MKSESYILIQGWMLNELMLKGNELLAYAIIYGFSKEGQGKFTGSRKYLSETLNISKSTAQAILESLVEKNLIFKTSNVISNITFNEYVVNENWQELVSDGIPKIGSEPLPEIGSRTLPKIGTNNTNINNSSLKNKESSARENFENRKVEFGKKLEPFSKQYPRNMLNDFYKYWTEPNKSGTKFKMELERTFDIARRLETWSRNEMKFGVKQPTNEPITDKRTRL